MRQRFRQLMKSVNRVEFTFEEIQRSLGEQGKLGWLFYILDDGRAHSQHQIAKDWMIPRSTLNAIVKKAQEAGFVELRPVPKTRRELEVFLTPKGQEAADQLLTPYKELEDQALQETIEKYSDHFIEVFDFFSKNLEKKIVQGIMEQDLKDK